jgi:hypothetical protein
MDGDLELRVQENDSGIIPKRQPWTSVHSFYVVMGGFVFDSSKYLPQDKFLPGHRDRITLSPKGVCFLAEHEPSLLPDLSESEILDKSKANQLAKGLVCLQALWFLAQCITRLAQGLAISLLELNTFAHTICTLIIYGLWWNKPLDIKQPTLIEDTRMDDICALMCHFSTISGDSLFLRFNKSGREPSPVLCLPHSSTAHSPPIIQSETSQAEQSQMDTIDKESKLYMGQSIAGVYYSRNSYRPASGRRGELGILNQSRPAHTYLPIDRRRWSLASQAYERYFPHESIEWKLYGYLYDYMRNWPKEFGIENIMLDISKGYFFDLDGSFRAFLAAFTIAGLLYGGLHLVAWNSPFTSHTQCLLWRISGIAIAASGPAVLMLMLISFVLANTMGVYTFNGSYFLSDILVMGFFMFYFFARTYLVIECFLSFAYLSPSVVQQPTWSQYFPHIS